MPGSATTPDRPNACDDALEHIAFRLPNGVGARDE
jgi:hypothetical protein